MSLDIAVRAASGLTLIATIQRLSDSFYWNDVASAFQAGPSFANKSISLTEGTSEDTSTYTASVTGLDTPEYILVRIHNSTGTRTLGLAHTYVREDEEIEAVANIYHTDTEFTIDDANTQDEYTVTWFKNAERITSGITSPTIQVIKRVDGTDLIASTAMTQVGTTGSYKYDETTNRATLGEDVIIIVSATIDGATRSFSVVRGRDSA